MNAKEAREEAESIKSQFVSREYKAIKDKILVAVRAGKFQIYNEWITPEVTKLLKDEGYTITPPLDIAGIVVNRSHPSTAISW